MNKNVKLIENLFTDKIPMIKSAVKELRSAKFYAIFLVSVILVGILSLSPEIASLVNSAVIKSTGRIVWEQTYVGAKSGSAEDIQAAVDEVAAMGGGNVYIPEGTFNFIDVGAPWETVYVPPGVNIIGAGMVDENLVFDETDQTDNWKTVLKLPYEYPTGVGDESDQYEFFELRNPNESSIGNRLSGFAIVGYRDELLAQGADPMAYPFPTFKAIKIFGVIDFRIDHVLIRNAGGGAVEVKNDYTGTVDYYGQGVIDHCKFINTAGWGCAGDHPRTFGDRTVGYGVGFRLSWNADFSAWEYDISKVLGTYSKTVFIEDCYFQRWRHCYCGNSGAHIVFRYNTINLDCAYGSIDSHEDYNIIATRAVEVYNNSIVNPNPYDPRAAINMRGGGGVFFNNTVTDYKFFIEMPVRWSNYECRPHDIWMWDNTIDVWSTVYAIDSSYIENVDWFLRTPSLAQDGFDYTPYPYPHPLTLEA